MRHSAATLVPVRYRAHPVEVRNAISHLIRTSPVPEATTIKVTCLEIDGEPVWVVRAYLADVEIARVEPQVCADDAA